MGFLVFLLGGQDNVIIVLCESTEKVKLLMINHHGTFVFEVALFEKLLALPTFSPPRLRSMQSDMMLSMSKSNVAK